MDKGILEHSFYLADERGEFVADGYGGETNEVYFTFGGEGRPHGDFTLTKEEVEKLHEYLTAWLTIREVQANLDALGMN